MSQADGLAPPVPPPPSAPREPQTSHAQAQATVIVSAAVIIERGRVLVTRRKRGAHLGGLWEFPGGKVLPGEDPRAALERELREELGIETVAGEILDVTFHRYEEAQKNVLLLFFEAARRDASIDPRAIEVDAFDWASGPDLGAERFPPADAAVLRKVEERLRRQPSVPSAAR